MKSRAKMHVSTTTVKKRVLTTTECKKVQIGCMLQRKLVIHDSDDKEKTPSPTKKAQPQPAASAPKTTVKSMESDVHKFHTMELLSLYITMSLKQVVNYKISPRKHLTELVEVVEDNLKTLKVDRQWFLATLRDHARIYHEEWMFSCDPKLTKFLHERFPFYPHYNMERHDEGLARYNTLLMVLSLRLGLDEPWVPDGHTEFDMDILEEELLGLYKPQKPTLELKHLNHYCSSFDTLFKHCHNLETITIHHSSHDLFTRSCQKFKNLRVLEYDGGLPDKDICRALWDSAKSSEDVISAFLKGDNKFTLKLPHLETLRSNIFADRGLEYMPAEEGAFRKVTASKYPHVKISVGAAALLLQPAMNIVEHESEWDTTDAVYYLLEISKQNDDNVRLGLRNLTLKAEAKFDVKRLKWLMRVCPAMDTLTLPKTRIPDTQFKSILEHMPWKKLKHLNLDTSVLYGEEFVRLVAHSSNLEKLTLHFSHSNFLCTEYIAYNDLARKILMKLDSGPQIKTLVLEFGNFPKDSDNLKAQEMLAFISCFPFVRTLILKNLINVPAKYLLHGCLSGALVSMRHLQHLSLLCYDMSGPYDFIVTVEKCYRGLFYSILNVIRGLPGLLDEFPEALFRLKTLELDEMYLAPRIDRMIEMLRSKGVAVAVKYRAYPTSSIWGIEVPEKLW